MGMSREKLKAAGVEPPGGTFEEYDGPLSFAFIVPGRPATKHRHGSSGRDAYIPKETKRYQQKVAGNARQSRPDGWPMDAQVNLELLFCYPDLKMADLSNPLKVIEDALEGVLYENDRQIWDGTQQKRLRQRADNCQVWIKCSVLPELTRQIKAYREG